MVLTIVLKINVPSDLTVEQYKEKLEKRLDVLKPDKTSIFQVQTIVYQSNAQQSPACVNQYLHSDFPATCFSILEPIQQNEFKVLSGDIGLASIQRRLCELNVFTEKKPLNMECIGTSSKLGDFLVRIGAVTHGGSNRGLICEISYINGNTILDSYGILSEFIQSVFGWNILEKSQTSNEFVISNYMRRKQHIAPYLPEDTILQYYEHFNFFRNVNLSK